MKLLGPITLLSLDYIPFTDTITSWASLGTNYSITYDPDTKHFEIPHASANDYYISWQVELMTANSSQYPILDLEFTYDGITRSDTMMSPMKTEEITNTSLFHITNVSETDLLSIGLKILDKPLLPYHFQSDSTADISANIIILGL